MSKWLLVSFFNVSPKSLFFVLLFPPSSKILKLACLFLFQLYGNFEKPLNSSSLKCPEALIIRQQVAFLIFNGGVRLISLEVIDLIAYLWNWALEALIIASKCFLGFHPLLSKAIGVNSLRQLPLQSAFEINTKAFPFKVYNMCPSF
jgi:hypothetical protein